MAVHVYVETTAALDIKDKPQLTATSFLSQLSGALNLWAGITVVIVIEIIEFWYEVVIDRINRWSWEATQSKTNHTRRRNTDNCDFPQILKFIVFLFQKENTMIFKLQICVIWGGVKIVMIYNIVWEPI